jgi:hypothetical protein
MHLCVYGRWLGQLSGILNRSTSAVALTTAAGSEVVPNATVNVNGHRHPPGPIGQHHARRRSAGPGNGSPRPAACHALGPTLYTSLAAGTQVGATRGTSRVTGRLRAASCSEPVGASSAEGTSLDRRGLGSWAGQSQPPMTKPAL